MEPAGGKESTLSLVRPTSEISHPGRRAGILLMVGRPVAADSPAMTSGRSMKRRRAQPDLPMEFQIIVTLPLPPPIKGGGLENPFPAIFRGFHPRLLLGRPSGAPSGFQLRLFLDYFFRGTELPFNHADEEYQPRKRQSVHTVL
jgi:hypothetical protein